MSSWARHQSTADGEHLLLAARQSAGTLIPLLRQNRKHGVDLIEVGCDGVVAAVDGAQAKIVHNRQRGEDLPALRHLRNAQADASVRLQMRNRRTCKDDRAAGGRLHTRDSAQKRRLARTIRADKRDDLTFLHLERNPVQDFDTAVAAFEVPNGQHRLATRSRQDRRLLLRDWTEPMPRHHPQASCHDRGRGCDRKSS